MAKYFENSCYYKPDADFKSEYIEYMRECLRFPLSDDESIISRHISLATDFTKFLSNRNKRVVIVYNYIVASIDDNVHRYYSFDDRFRVKIINLILTALMFPSLMGDKPVIGIHLMYSDDVRRETLDFFHGITENSFIENRLFTYIFNALFMHFPADRLWDVLNNFHPDYQQMILDYSDCFIKVTKENMENRLVLIRFIREHSGDSDQIRL